ncbi:hypothetical protein [Micromonospora halophytica]|uniref:hypothetical protein n=1 Tax=Micromonospora halophytica TaxID=47864 RepID=UPI000B855D4F|nr:hypothetical protein [Micromonospora halophytica]
MTEDIGSTLARRAGDGCPAGPPGAGEFPDPPVPGVPVIAFGVFNIIGTTIRRASGTYPLRDDN